MGVYPLIVDSYRASAHVPVPRVILQRPEEASGSSGPSVAGRGRTDFKGMNIGRCDLDIFLNPFFRPLPRPRSLEYWFSGRKEGPDPANLLEALRVPNSAFPWLTQYQLSSEPHPGTFVPPIKNKFCSVLIGFIKLNRLVSFFLFSLHLPVLVSKIMAQHQKLRSTSENPSLFMRDQVYP